MSKILGTLMKTVYSVGNIPIDMKKKRLDPVKAQTKELVKLLRKVRNLCRLNQVLIYPRLNPLYMRNLMLHLR